MKTVCGTPGYCGEFPTERFELKKSVGEAVVLYPSDIQKYLSLEKKSPWLFVQLFELCVFQAGLLVLHHACFDSGVFCVSQPSSHLSVWELTACSPSLSPQLLRFSVAMPTVPKWTCGLWESSSTYCECYKTLGNLSQDLDVLSSPWASWVEDVLGTHWASHRKHYQTWSDPILDFPFSLFGCIDFLFRIAWSEGCSFLSEASTTF